MCRTWCTCAGEIRSKTERMHRTAAHAVRLCCPRRSHDGEEVATLAALDAVDALPALVPVVALVLPALVVPARLLDGEGNTGDGMAARVS